MDFKEKLEGKRIVLLRPYPPTFDLAQKIFAEVIVSQENLRPWLPWANKEYKQEDAFVYLTDWCEKSWNEKKGFAYIICDKQTGKFMGCIDAMDINDKHKSCEIGYWISINYQGNGYMHEALELLEAECFRAGINRIVISNDTRNIRSANVAKRAGYHLDGILRQNRWDGYANMFVDSNVWSKIKDIIDNKV